MWPMQANFEVDKEMERCSRLQLVKALQYVILWVGLGGMVKVGWSFVLS